VLLWWIGGFAIVFGVLLFAGAFRVRRVGSAGRFAATAA
jgi:hypothetical protein